MLSKMCQDYKQNIIDGIEAFNKALREDDLQALNAADEAIKKAESEYAVQAEMDLFSEHKDDENPVVSILKEGFYGVIRHKAVREEGILLYYEIDEDAEKQVDIMRMFNYFNGMCKYPKKSNVWKYRTERLSEVLTEWVHEELGLSAKHVKDTFKMNKKAKEIKGEANPTSNTSLLKLLNSCIDEIVFVAGEDGKNTVIANRRDLKFMQLCFAGEGRGRNTIKVMKLSGVVRIIGKILYRVLNDYAYDVDFKHIVEKSPSLEAQRAANRRAKAEKEAAKAEDSEAVVVSREETSEDAA